jgi:putative nucleotidyltransferase with HDIG domain
MNLDLEAACRKVKPLSPSLVNLLQITAKNDHGLGDVLGIIQLDSVLTAAILRAANSAAFRKAEEVDSLNLAVSLLGERFVVGVAMDLCSDGFFEQPLAGYESAAGDLWRHSIKTAIAARLFSRYARRPVDSNQAFTAGILHDIGKVVLSTFMEGSAAEMALSVAEGRDSLSYLEAEKNKLGSNHCEAGLVLADHWRLPECYRAAIAWHHEPDKAPPEMIPFVYTIHLGDAMAMMTGAATGSDSMLYPLNPNYLNHFKLTPETTQLVLLELEREYDALCTSMERKTAGKENA